MIVDFMFIFISMSISALDFSLLIYLPIGILIGFLAALFGMGGGFLTVPALDFMGIEFHHAVGTSSASIPFTSASSTVAYLRQRRVQYKVGILLALPAIIGAYIGASLTSFLTSSQLKLIFGIAMILVAFVMSLNKNSMDPGEEMEDIKVDYRIIPLGGLLSGVASGLLGVGGGVVNVPFLNLLGFPIHYAVATSSLAIFITSLSSATSHHLLGNVDFELMVFMVPGLIIGAQIGARVARKMKARNIKKFFSVVVVLLGLKMIFNL